MCQAKRSYLMICDECKQRFSDIHSLKVHTDISHHPHALVPEHSRSPNLLTETRSKSMNVGQLKAAPKGKQAICVR